MKNILIPTDFSIKSLNQVKYAVELLPDEILNITLFHVLHMPDGIGDLLMFGKRRSKAYEQIGPDFQEGCEILKNKYATRVAGLHTVFLYGNSQAIFRNFLEGNRADMVLLPVDYTFRKFSRDSVDPVRMISRASCPVVRLELGTRTRKEEITPAVLSDLLSAYS